MSASLWCHARSIWRMYDSCGLICPFCVPEAFGAWPMVNVTLETRPSLMISSFSFQLTPTPNHFLGVPVTLFSFLLWTLRISTKATNPLIITRLYFLCPLLPCFQFVQFFVLLGLAPVLDKGVMEITAEIWLKFANPLRHRSNNEGFRAHSNTALNFYVSPLPPPIPYRFVSTAATLSFQSSHWFEKGTDDSNSLMPHRYVSRRCTAPSVIVLLYFGASVMKYFRKALKSPIG